MKQTKTMKEGILGIHRKLKLKDFLNPLWVLFCCMMRIQKSEWNLTTELTWLFSAMSTQNRAKMDNRAIFPCIFFRFQAVSHCSDFNMKKIEDNFYLHLWLKSKKDFEENSFLFILSLHGNYFELLIIFLHFSCGKSAFEFLNLSNVTLS